MTTPSITEVTSQVVALLSPLGSEERQRVAQAAFILLGESFAAKPALVTPPQGQPGDAEPSTFSPKAKKWTEQNGLQTDMLQEVFHFESDGKVNVIASTIPGNNKTEQTINTYLIQGIANYLATGIPAVDDKSARDLCKTFGCHDTANHSVILRKMGNKLIGSKSAGWTVTAPGLSYGATMIKTMTKGQQ